MKNTENAAMPISAMSQRLFFPRRLSGRPEQVSRSADMRSSTVPTPSLNLTRHQLDTVHIHPDSISRTLTKAALPARMRISMRKIREVLRLTHELGLSVRQVREATGVGKTAVSEYVSRAKVVGITWPIPPEITDADLERRLFAPAGFHV